MGVVIDSNTNFKDLWFSVTAKKWQFFHSIHVNFWSADFEVWFWTFWVSLNRSFDNIQNIYFWVSNSSLVPNYHFIRLYCLYLFAWVVYISSACFVFIILLVYTQQKNAQSLYHLLFAKWVCITKTVVDLCFCDLLFINFQLQMCKKKIGKCSIRI